MQPGRLWTPAELAGPTVPLASTLLGSYLVRELDGQRFVGRIVETEAYTSIDDPACHASRGQTARNAAMFGTPGCAYVYMIYGMYHCLNIVTEPAGTGSAVLVRALEPIEGPTGTNGPGRLCKAYAIDRGLDHADLTTPGPLTLHQGVPVAEVGVSRRIGITKGVELLWRFYETGNAYVSRPPR